MSAEVKIQGVLDTMVKFAAMTRRAVSDVMPQQVKLFTRDVVKLTPPFQSFSARDSFAAQRKAGEEATSRDVGRVFKPIESLGIWSSSNPVAEEVRNATRRGDSAKLGELLYRCGYQETPQPIPLTLAPAHHRDQRNKRGRVRRNPSRVFVRLSDFRSYVKRKVSQVGRLKAGWAPAAAQFGLSLPAWITRHSGLGTVRDHSKRYDNPEIILTNGVSYISEQDATSRFVGEALKRRDTAMARQIDAKLKGRF